MPSWTIKTLERLTGAASPRFSRQSRIRAFSSLPMMIRASEPPIKFMRYGLCSCFLREIDIFCGFLQSFCDNNCGLTRDHIYQHFLLNQSTQNYVNRYSIFHHIGPVSRCARSA